MSSYGTLGEVLLFRELFLDGSLIMIGMPFRLGLMTQ